MKIKILSLPKHSFVDGGDTGNGVTMFRGIKHGQFGLNGIPQGIASDGLPNYVEGGGFDKNGNPLEGEIKYKDYIYSARNKVSKSLLKKYNLPEKYADKKFAEVAEQLQKESKDRPNDPVSKTTLDEMMERLAQAQEEYNYKREQRRLTRAFNRLSPEDKMAFAQMTLPQQPPVAMENPYQEIPQEEVEQPIDYNLEQYANGGSIHIKPSKKGTFTAAATKHGKSVQAFASQVLANPDNYSTAMVRKANFARNASKWHSDGGHLFQDGRHIFSSPYKQGDVYYINESQLFGKDRYGSQGAFGNLFTRNADNTYTRNSLMDDYFNNITDDEYTQIMNLYNDYVKQHSLKWPHAPKTKNDAARWLRDSQNDLSKIQDWHAFVNALYKRPAEGENTPNIGNPNMTKRFWILNNDGTRIPLNINDVTAEVPGYTYDSTLDETEGVLNDGSGIYDYYFTPNEGSTIARNTPINNNTNVSEPLQRDYLRLAGLLNYGYSPADFTYSNALRGLAGMYRPMAATGLPRERMNYFDVNLGNNQAMAQNAAAQRDIRNNTNRWQQNALSLAQQQQSFNNNALFNVNAQQAQENERLNVDKINFDLAKAEQALQQQYDSLNANIQDRKINMLAEAEKAADAATTLASTNRSQSLTNFLNNLSALGKENWSRNERDKLIRFYGPNILKYYPELINV